jgi:hypothetical protein
MLGTSRLSVLVRLEHATIYAWTGTPDQPAMIRMDLRKMRQIRDAAGRYFLYNVVEYHRRSCAT